MTHVPVLVTGAAGFVGSHLLDLLAAEARRIVGWRRPRHAPAAATAHGGARGTPWTARPRRGRRARDRATSARRSSTTRRRRARRQSWRHTVGTTLAGATSSAPTTCSTRSAARRLDAARARRRLGAGLRAVESRRSTRTSPSRPPEPVRREQAGAGDAGAARRASDDGLDVIVARSFNHIGPRQSPAFVAASFARQIALHRSGPRRARAPASATSSRGATSPTCATPCAPTRALVERGTPGTAYNVCRGEALAIRELVDGARRRARECPWTIDVDPAARAARGRPARSSARTRGSPRDTGWQPESRSTRTLDDLLDYWREQSRMHSEPERPAPQIRHVPGNLWRQGLSPVLTALDTVALSGEQSTKHGPGHACFRSRSGPPRATSRAPSATGAAGPRPARGAARRRGALPGSEVPLGAEPRRRACRSTGR